MSRFRMYPTPQQEHVMLEHCAHARYVWNLAVEQHSHWSRDRQPAPGFAEQCRQLTEARHESEWLRAGNARVQQQALKDFAKAKAARFTSGFGEPTWRKKSKHEGFRVIGTDRVPAFGESGGTLLSPRCSACGWIEKNSRKSQAEFICVSCGFTCNADNNAAVNVAAGQVERPGRPARAGGMTPPDRRSSVREPQLIRVGIPFS